MTNNKASVVIVGAGFAGVSCYQELTKRLGVSDVKVIDVRESFEYTPSLHLALVNDKKDNQIKISNSKLFGDNFVKDEVVNVQEGLVKTKNNGDFLADYIVVASGARTNFFGNKSFEEHTLPCKCLNDVNEIRNRLKNAKSVTVIGGGYTGVEIASVLASRTDKKIRIVHSRERLLHTLSPKVSKLCEDYLKKRGVEFYMNSRAKHCVGNCLTLENGQTIESDMSIYTAGIAANTELVAEKVEMDGFKVKGNAKIFMCGDSAVGTSLPTAHNAMIEGRKVAGLVAAELNGKKNVVSEDDWRTLVVALGPMDGVVTFGETGGISVPVFSGLMKWVVERRVMFEFNHGLKLPL